MDHVRSQLLALSTFLASRQNPDMKLGELLLSAAFELFVRDGTLLPTSGSIRPYGSLKMWSCAGPHQQDAARNLSTAWSMICRRSKVACYGHLQSSCAQLHKNRGSCTFRKARRAKNAAICIAVANLSSFRIHLFRDQERSRRGTRWRRLAGQTAHFVMPLDRNACIDSPNGGRNKNSACGDLLCR